MNNTLDTVFQQIRASLVTGMEVAHLTNVSIPDRTFFVALSYIMRKSPTELYRKFEKFGPVFNFHEMDQRIISILSKTLPISLIVFEDSWYSPMFGSDQTENPILCKSSINMDKKHDIGMIYMHKSRDTTYFAPYEFYNESFTNKTPVLKKRTKEWKIVVDFHASKCDVQLKSPSSTLLQPNKISDKIKTYMKSLATKDPITRLFPNSVVYFYDVATGKIVCNTSHSESLLKPKPNSILVFNRAIIDGQYYYRPYTFGPEQKQMLRPKDADYKKLLQMCAGARTDSDSDSKSSTSSISSSESSSNSSSYEKIYDSDSSISNDSGGEYTFL